MKAKGNTEWKQWEEAEKDDIALIMSRTELTGRRKIRTISIYPYWIIKSRNGQKKWLYLRRSWRAHRLFWN